MRLNLNDIEENYDDDYNENDNTLINEEKENSKKKSENSRTFEKFKKNKKLNE